MQAKNSSDRIPSSQKLFHEYDFFLGSTYNLYILRLIFNVMWKINVLSFRRVVESMVSEGLIEEDDKPVVMRSLLLRHKHVHDERFRFSIGGKKQSSYTSLQVCTNLLQ